MGDWAFQYDTLNRLTVASPAANAPTAYRSSTGCWNYDAFGNRTLAAFISASDCSGQTTPTATYNTANQITSLSQSGPISYTWPNGPNYYDSSGNVILDPSNTTGGSTTGASYAYDGEGRLCAVREGTNGPVTQYFYDASGRRVAKGALSSSSFPATNSVCSAPAANQSYSNLYLLNLAGEQVTELVNNAGTWSWKHTNVWSGAHLSATYDKANGSALHFHISDPLGTRRVQVNATGQVEETCQSLPFGENLNCSQPSGAPATADDATEHHFTGKERDAESGNDYFGAR